MDMHARVNLPDQYKRTEIINLQKDKKTALKVNGLAMVLMVVMIALGVPLTRFRDIDSALDHWWGCLVLFGAMVVYGIAHELTHAAVMKFYGGRSVRFGFTGMYAYAGSTEDFFDKHSYFRIALAPFVFWGVVFTAACFLVHGGWFWLFYMLQVMNVSGAGGDIYVVYHFRKYPADTWFRDTGIEMEVFRAE